jgi:hypothetical protein
MENEISFVKNCDGRTIIPMTPFPVFIKSTPGTEDQLCAALSQYGTPVMGPNLHNGSFTASSAGYWYNTPTAIPAGWVQTAPTPYTTATMFIQTGSTGEAVNNTGEVVQGNYVYTVSADLGGGTGTDATVRVYATKNANGSGDKVLLVSVHRVGLAGDGYNLFPVSNAGSPTAANLAGYFVQVSIGGPYIDHYISGNYDNIVITAIPVAEESICCGDANHPHPAGDLNQDCYVNWQDIAKFVGRWLANCAGSSWCNGADLNEDSNVNVKDIAVFAATWLTCTDPMPPCGYNP